MNSGGVTPAVATLVLGLIGVALSYLAHRLNKRGQAEEIRLKEATQLLNERARAFDEMEKINERLGEENTRLRLDVERQSQSEDRAIQRQANRCRVQLEGLIEALATLRDVVLSEVASTSAQRQIETAMHHIETDHGPHDPVPGPEREH